MIYDRRFSTRTKSIRINRIFFVSSKKSTLYVDCRYTQAICIVDTCQWPRQPTIPVRIFIFIPPLYALHYNGWLCVRVLRARYAFFFFATQNSHDPFCSPRKPLFNHIQNVQQTENVFLDCLREHI